MPALIMRSKLAKVSLKRALDCNYLWLIAEPVEETLYANGTGNSETGRKKSLNFHEFDKRIKGKT